MYKSLYRIFRPKQFKDSIGQEYIVEILKNQLIENKVGHAYLFTGVRGTGKTTFAKILAKAVNCLNLKDGEPCLKCENCKGIEEGSILDVIEMDAASNTGVDNIRDIIEETNYLPTKAKFRVYIIDEVHMLSSGAFNALLKTLEEPPSHVKFILATTEPQKLPATILSRCQRFDFKKVSRETLSKYLGILSKESNIDISQEALDLIASLGEGSVRDSISILESAKSLEGKIEEKDIRNIIGIPTALEVIEIIIEILNGNEKSVSSAKNILDEGKESKTLLEEMIKILEASFIKEKDKVSKYSKEEKNKILEIVKEDKENMYHLLKSLLDLENNLRWSEKKNTIFLAKIIELTMYFQKEEKKEESSLNPEDIVNILKNKNEDTNKENKNENEKEEKKEIKIKEQSKENPKNNEQNKEKKKQENTLNLNNNKTSDIILNKLNMQKKLTKLGEMQIFVLISNSDLFVSDGKVIVQKKENFEANENNINIARDNHTKETLEEIISKINNKKINVEMKGW